MLSRATEYPSPTLTADRAGLECLGRRGQRCYAAAQCVCEEIGLEYGWPNDYYLPEDSLGILTYCGGDILNLLNEIWDRLGVAEVTFAQFVITTRHEIKTLGSFVDMILQFHAYAKGKNKGVGRSEVFDWH